MILTRLGNKQAFAHKIYLHFPKHSIYLEPFFGAGGMFFNKPKAKHNFLNDIDDDVYNLFRYLIDNKDKLIKQIKITPIIDRQFKEWSSGIREKNDLLNAVRFLILSNFSLFGKSDTLRIGANAPKASILSMIEQTFDYLKDVYLLNVDFRQFFKKISYKDDIDRCFCYCDPPYLNTGNNYQSGFTEQDSIDLFEVLQNSGMKWAMSEFDNPFILSQAEKRGLHITTIGERVNIRNKRIEILITNYAKAPTLFD